MRGATMRVVAVTPIHVTEQELKRRQQRYDRIAPAGLKVELRNLAEPAITALNQPADVRSSDTLLAEEINQCDLTEFDFFMPDCVLDPGFRKNQTADVVGMLELVVSNLVTQGHQVGAVTRNQAIGDELVRRVGEYGFADNFAGLELLDLSFDAINDEELWHEKLAAAVEKLAANGATVVINGCSAVNVDQSKVKVPVVDPAQMALEILVSKK